MFYSLTSKLKLDFLVFNQFLMPDAAISGTALHEWCVYMFVHMHVWMYDVCVRMHGTTITFCIILYATSNIKLIINLHSCST